jgi:hypothetical protein
MQDTDGFSELGSLFRPIENLAGMTRKYKKKSLQYRLENLFLKLSLG